MDSHSEVESAYGDSYSALSFVCLKKVIKITIQLLHVAYNLQVGKTKTWEPSKVANHLLKTLKKA